MFARRLATAALRTHVPRRSAVASRNFWSASSSRPAFSGKLALAVAGAAATVAAFTTYTTFSLGVNGSQGAVYADTGLPIFGRPGTAKERTFIAVKPDGTQRGIIGEVISRFERRGYKLVGLKLLVPPRDLVSQHYADLSSKPFYNGLVDYMSNGKAPVVGMVWEGPDVIKQGRRMLGATNPLDSAPGTIRGDFCLSIGRNIIHGSDSAEAAEKEITLWFGGEGQVFDWTPANQEWVISNN